MSSEGCGLSSDALHQVAIEAHYIYVEVEDFAVRSIEVGRQPLAPDRYPDARTYPLSQRPGGCFYASGDVRLRMSRSPAVELSEVLDVIHRDGQLFRDVSVLVDLTHFREMQHRVEQHG